MNAVQTTFLSLLKAPIRIASKNFPCSYSNAEIAFLSEQWAKKEKAYYLNLSDYFESIWTNHPQKHQLFFKQLKENQSIITSPLTLPSLKSIDFNTYWTPLFQELKNCENPKKIVLPLTFVPNYGPLAHCACCCLNLTPKTKLAQLIFLEQHAQDSAQPDYDKSVDYAPILKEYESVFRAALQQLGGFQKVDSFINTTPICRTHNVCGVVASEVCRQMLASNHPMTLAKRGIIINPFELPIFHQRNQKLHTESFIIKKQFKKQKD